MSELENIQKEKYTLFISDLHLHDRKNDLNLIFSNFLQSELFKNADTLYILGDLFNFWIGDDYKDLYHQQIVKTIKEASKLTPIKVMHGNRDFLLGNKFAVEANVELIPDPYIFILYGKKVILKHGDDLCVKDRMHQYFRIISRSPLSKGLFLFLPYYIRSKIAHNINKYSSRRTAKIIKQQRQDLLDSDIIVSKKLLDQYNAQVLIHGHTHMPQINYLSTDPQQRDIKIRVVISDWRKNGYAILINDKQDILTKVLD